MVGLFRARNYDTYPAPGSALISQCEFSFARCPLPAGILTTGLTIR